MRTVLTTPPLLWRATSHASSNRRPASLRPSAMLEEVDDLPWSALYALEFLAYFGVAGFLLAAKRSGGARCLLYSLCVFGYPALLAQRPSRLVILSWLALALPKGANSGSASYESLAPRPCWHSVAQDSRTLRGWCWPFLNVSIQEGAFIERYGQLAAHPRSKVSAPPSALPARLERETSATAARHCCFMLLLAPKLPTVAAVYLPVRGEPAPTAPRPHAWWLVRAAHR
jgi:hypothetical protein